MRLLRFTQKSRADYKNVLESSKEEFGSEIAERYMHLLSVALQELVNNPHTIGTQQVESYSKFTRYPIRWCKFTAQVDGKTIRNPRHIIYFEYLADEEIVRIARILKDSRDPDLHL